MWGHLGGSVVEHLPLAWVMVPESWGPISKILKKQSRVQCDDLMFLYIMVHCEMIDSIKLINLFKISHSYLVCVCVCVCVITRKIYSLRGAWVTQLVGLCI